jgi:hypothetical protein
MDNFAFQCDASVSSPSNSEEDVIEAQIETVNAAANVVVPLSEWRSRLRRLWSNYHWRMRHYFYLHLFVFFCNTLICGAIVWGTEHYKVPYIDCWFVSATCVFTCGLQTYDFAFMNRTSQSVLLFYTWISGNRLAAIDMSEWNKLLSLSDLGITISTVPAIFIKLYRVKHEIVNSEEEATTITVDQDVLPIRRLVPSDIMDSDIYARIHSLPTPQHLRITAYILTIVLILATCSVIYLTSFLAMGIWLKYHYEPKDLLQGNETIDPFYAAVVITITGFNQNGLSPW